MTPEEEQEWIREAQLNSASFVKLYDRYYAQIFGYIFRRVLDMERSKDICSETFMKAYVRLGSFRWKGIAFRAWLYRIATNEMNMADRQKKYKTSSLDTFIGNACFDLVDPKSLEAEKAAVEKQ